MGCGSSQEQKPEARGNNRRRKKKAAQDVNFSNIDDPPQTSDKQPNPPVKSPAPAEQQPAVSLEAKKLSLAPTAMQQHATVQASNAAQQQQQAQVTEQNTAAKPAHHGPITGTIDPGKKVTLRQTVQLAIQIAKQQREKIGKFRRDERHSVMELYELMGLENDAPIAPQTEFQMQLSRYSYPPENMHMLRDVEVVDEQTMVTILGEEEYRRRKDEGIVTAAPSKTTSTAPRRAGVSAEVTRHDGKEASFFKSIAKTKQQTVALTQAMKRTILFRGLDETELHMLFNAFEMEEFAENDVIFEKGTEGDRFFLIERGRCQIVLTDEDGTEKGSVFVGDGDTFGELGVMYGTPRAATVIAALPTTTWWIDRDTYRGLLLMQTKRKRDRFKAFLQSIDVFSRVDDYERARIADVLETMEVEPGTVIVREGEPGDTFYMIEEGEVEVSTEQQGVLTTLQRSRYFGELALLFDKPRQATVRAVRRTKLCVLGRANFANYLGPFENILRRNADQYRRVLQSATAA